MSDFKIMESRRRIPGAEWSTLVLVLALSISMIVTNSTLLAQRQMTLGAMQNVPQLNTINPANMPDSIKWYLGIPLLSGVNAHYRNSSFTPGQLGLRKGSGPDYSMAMGFTDSLNNAYGELYIEDLAVGFNLGNNFLSLSVAERIFASADYPFQLIEWLGLEQEGADIPLGRTFELASLEFSGTHYREIALGFGRRLFDGKLTLGGRFKLLLGQASVQSDNYNLRLWHRPEDDYNYEITGRMDILASGFDRFGEGASPFQLFGQSNTGIAFDLGAQLKLGKVTLFASVNDLGKLNWKKNNSFTSLTDIAVSSDELFERATDNLANDRERGASNFSTELVTKVYAGGQFEIGSRHAFTVLANPRLYLGSTEMNGSVAYRFRTSRYLDVIASYNFFGERKNSVGVGATLNLKPVQIYFATDKIKSVLDRSGQRDFHFAAGINLIFGQTKEQMVIAKTEKKNKKQNPDIILPDEAVSKVNKHDKDADPQEEVVTTEPFQDKYFTFYGTVIDDETDEPLEAIYVDVYVIGPDDRRELIHTSRYPGHTFNVPLFQSELQHEISVGGHGYARQTLTFRANIQRLEHEFRMSDGLWSTESTESSADADQGEVKLVSGEQILPEPELDRTYAANQDPEVQESLVATEIDGIFEIIQRTSLRSEPNAQARVMKRLSVGTNLVLLEKTDKFWWKMKLGDQIGFVKQRLLASVQ